jgi:hypothetical protein
MVKLPVIVSSGERKLIPEAREGAIAPREIAMRKLGSGRENST